MAPRPHSILKRNQSPAIRPPSNNPLPFATCKTIRSPHVHFPPTPCLIVSTHPVHSPQTYDRKPIVVSPTEGVLPPNPPSEFEVERTDRGRPRGSRAQDDIKGSYFHPRAYEACEPEDLDPFLTPPLLMRDSSPSSVSSGEDSDEAQTPPDLKLSSPLSTLVRTLHHTMVYEHTSEQEDNGHGASQSSLPLHMVKEGFLEKGSYVSRAGGEGCLGGF